MLKKQYLKSEPRCKVTFILPKEAAPDASEIRLLGDFNNWSWDQGILMKPAKEGYKATVELETGSNYEFRYLIDGEAWVNDWDADDYVSSPYHGIENSVVHIEDQASVPAKKAAKKPAKMTAKKAAPAKAQKPAAGKKASPKKKDDLKKIEGVGPKIEELLIKGGIDSFESLAEAKLPVLKNILKDAGPRYKMHEPGTWSKQAKLALKGEWEKLEKLQGELKGGKKTK
jgi:predicted flap endonuclease-1-like 5' DNA nuclease